MPWKRFLAFFFLILGTEGKPALVSYEFVGEQSRKEENAKHVPSCTSPNEGVGCVRNVTTCSRLAPSPDKLFSNNVCFSQYQNVNSRTCLIHSKFKTY